MTSTYQQPPTVGRFAAANSLAVSILVVGWTICAAAYWDVSWSPGDRRPQDALALIGVAAYVLVPATALAAAALIKRRVAAHWPSSRAWLSSLAVIVGAAAVLVVSIAAAVWIFRVVRITTVYEFRWPVGLVIPIAAQVVFVRFASRLEANRAGAVTAAH